MLTGQSRIELQKVGRINNVDQFISFFKSKFTDAVLVSSRSYESTEILNNPQGFKTEILKNIGTELNGVVLDDLLITKLSKIIA